jgi:hypothetical protein
VDRTEVCVLEKVDEECLGCFLEGLDRLRLPPHTLIPWAYPKGYFPNLQEFTAGQRDDSFEAGWDA